MNRSCMLVVSGLFIPFTVGADDGVAQGRISEVTPGT